jgi:hypothetical protein
MLPPALPALQLGRVSLAVLSITPAQRETLTAWAVELCALIERRSVVPARERNASLRNQFATAIRATHEAIAEACAEPKGELLEAAIAAAAPYFEKRGDARAAVRSFPAVVDLAFFLAGPEPETTLDGLVRQASEALATIEKILAHGEVWHFTGAGA